MYNFIRYLQLTHHAMTKTFHLDKTACVNLPFVHAVVFIRLPCSVGFSGRLERKHTSRSRRQLEWRKFSPHTLHGRVLAYLRYDSFLTVSVLPRKTLQRHWSLKIKTRSTACWSSRAGEAPHVESTQRLARSPLFAGTIAVYLVCKVHLISCLLEGWSTGVKKSTSSSKINLQHLRDGHVAGAGQRW